MSDWPADPVPWLVAIVAVAAYAIAWRAVNAKHPASPIPAWRLAAWLGGWLAILGALASPIDTLADDLLTAHMGQHLLLAMVAPPLLALGAPVLVLLRISTPGVRSRFVLPALHSRLVRFSSSPLLAWLLFTIVMWATHFTPIYEAALENEQLHVMEHMAFLATGCLFWWHVVGADPMPRRLGFVPRQAYVLAQMPVNAAVGLVIYFAPTLLYAHYAVAAPARGINAMTDQQIGGLVMWGVGDVLLLASFVALVAAWMRVELRRQERGGRLASTGSLARTPDAHDSQALPDPARAARQRT